MLLIHHFIANEISYFHPFVITSVTQPHIRLQSVIFATFYSFEFIHISFMFVHKECEEILVVPSLVLAVGPC